MGTLIRLRAFITGGAVAVVYLKVGKIVDMSFVLHIATPFVAIREVAHNRQTGQSNDDMCPRDHFATIHRVLMILRSPSCLLHWVVIPC